MENEKLLIYTKLAVFVLVSCNDGNVINSQGYCDGIVSGLIISKESAWVSLALVHSCALNMHTLKNGHIRRLRQNMTFWSLSLKTTTNVCYFIRVQYHKNAADHRAGKLFVVVAPLACPQMPFLSFCFLFEGLVPSTIWKENNWAFVNKLRLIHVDPSEIKIRKKYTLNGMHWQFQWRWRWQTNTLFPSLFWATT